jgi:hypothetical protein
VLLAALVLSPALAFGQTGKINRPVDQPRRESSDPDDPEQNSSLPDEMRIRMLIARRESEHKKIMESVDKLSETAVEVAERFRRDGQLSNSDFKAINEIEKLARRVLTHAGGDVVEAETRQQPTVAEAIDKIATAASKIKEEMTAETRFVVSATVIANSNEVIKMSRLVKRTQKN